MRKVVAVLALIIALLALVTYAYWKRGQAAGNMGPGPGPGRGTMAFPVRTMAVTEGSIAKHLNVTGAISAKSMVEVYPKQQGEVIKVFVDVGDEVNIGDPIAQIDPTYLDIQKRQAEAELISAQAAYDKSLAMGEINSEISYRQAKSSLDRMESLLKQAQIDFEMQKKKALLDVSKAESDLRIAQARLDATRSGARKQELDQARVRVENAKRELERSKKLYEAGMIPGSQLEAVQLQYDIYSAQLSLLEEGAREEDIEVLEAQLAAAKIALEAAENNKLSVDVKEELINSAKAQLDSAKATFDQAAASKENEIWRKELAQAKSALMRAQASFDLAKRHLEDCVIRSPVKGIVAERFVDVGDIASLNKSAFTIADMDTVKVIANVPSRDVVHIRAGMKATIMLDVYPGKKFDGIVARISPIIDRSSQNCPVEIEAKNPSYLLKPGMFTEVELVVEKKDGVISIPSDVIMKRGNEIFAFVVENGKAVRRDLSLGISDATRSEVVSGLKVGDLLVIFGQNSLRDGAPVMLVDQSNKPESQDRSGREAR